MRLKILSFSFFALPCLFHKSQSLRTFRIFSRTAGLSHGPLPPHPAQCSQSHPHCRDLPLFLSRTIFLIINPTMQAKTAAVTIVPIINPSPFLFCSHSRFFHIHFQGCALFIGPEKQINKSDYQKKRRHGSYSKYS